MAFSWYRTVTIDHTKVGASDSTNFPMLISGTYAYLATVANSGKVQNSLGDDIGFYSDSALTTKLAWETELYTAASGKVLYWVKVPTVSHTVDTVIYIAYDDASISTDQSNKTGTWNSGFDAVYHGGDGVTVNVNDSTANAFNGTNSSTGAATGQIGGAFHFQTGNEYIDLGTSSTLQSQKPTAVSAWIYPDLNNLNMAIWGGDSSATGYFSFKVSNSNTLEMDKSYVVAFGTSTDVVAVSTWQLVVGSYDGSGNVAFYINGVAKNHSALNNQTLTGTAHARIGQDAATQTWYGRLDEVRKHNTIRSADWWLTEYNNQSSPSTFYTIGSETAAGGATGVAATGLLISAPPRGTFPPSQFGRRLSAYPPTGPGGLTPIDRGIFLP